MNQALGSLRSAVRSRRLAPWLTALVLVVLAGFLLWRGYGFYRLGDVERTDHVDYATLRASGFLGHGYGMVGTALIATNLFYLVRRRFTKRFPAWAGSTKAWLNMHVVTGLGGSLLVLFHSAFQLRTPIATVTSLSLAIVVITGLVGFSIYGLVPKAGLTPFKDRIAQIETLLPDLSKRVVECVEGAPYTRLADDASFARTIFTVPRWLFEARARRRRVRVAARDDKLFRVLSRDEPVLARRSSSSSPNWRQPKSTRSPLARSCARGDRSTGFSRS